MFIEIDLDSDDSDILAKRHISLDQIQEAAIFGPIFPFFSYMDFSETENMIDEESYQAYIKGLELGSPTFHLHILLKTGELISRHYPLRRVEDMKKIYGTIQQNSVSIGSDMRIRSVPLGLSGKIKFYAVDEESYDESGNLKTLKYRQIEIETSANLGDGKYKLLTKVVNLFRDILKTRTNKSNN